MTRVFGTAGVRGVFNKTQTPEQVYKLAETVAFAFGKGKFGVGWDGRKTSALLARTVASAVNSVGSDVAMFGTVPTPLIAFGTKSRSCLAGFAITASHNPPEFSGVKLFTRSGMELDRPDEERIERALAVDVMKSSGTFGELAEDSWVVDDYVAALVSKFGRAPSPLKIAVDCATGPGGLVTPQVLASLGHRVISVNAQVSWRFPARPPEPTPGNMSDFAKAVQGMDVDFGFAHDGDADRLVMVSRGGAVVPDSIVSILALRELGVRKGTVVISENTSMAVEEAAKKQGFRVVRAKVGKTFTRLEPEGAVFATEPSKIVDPAWGLWEDGIMAAAMISDQISREPGLLLKTLEEMRWNYRQVNLNVKANMTALVPKARDALQKHRISEERSLDGHKFVFHDGSWIMFRTSGTEPKTRVYCESKDLQMLQQLVQQGTQLVESSL